MIPIREKLDDMLVVSLVARAVISVLAGFVFGFVGWLIAWLLIPYMEFTGLALPITGSIMLGLATSVTATLVFWDAYHSPGRKVIFAASVIGSATIACVITFLITIGNPKYTYLTRGVIFPMINFGTFTATFVAAGFYLYREVFQTAEYRDR